eukprot:3541791-Pyramimonas_sp.AAC.2
MKYIPANTSLRRRTSPSLGGPPSPPPHAPICGRIASLSPSELASGTKSTHPTIRFSHVSGCTTRRAAHRASITCATDYKRIATPVSKLLTIDSDESDRDYSQRWRGDSSGSSGVYVLRIIVTGCMQSPYNVLRR